MFVSSWNSEPKITWNIRLIKLKCACISELVGYKLKKNTYSKKYMFAKRNTYAQKYIRKNKHG